MVAATAGTLASRRRREILESFRMMSSIDGPIPPRGPPIRFPHLGKTPRDPRPRLVAGPVIVLHQQLIASAQALLAQAGNDQDRSTARPLAAPADPGAVRPPA